MSGRPGTPRFGEYSQVVSGKPGPDGTNTVCEQSGNDFTEQHFLYDPDQQSRDMGGTLGGDPRPGYSSDPRIYNAPSNHDGFMGGQDHINQLDERKVLEETMWAVPCVYADDWQHNFDSDERSA